MGGRDEREESAFLDRFSDILSDPAGMTDDEIRSELADEGIEVDRFMNRCLKTMAEKEKSIKPDWREIAMANRNQAEKTLSRSSTTSVSDHWDKPQLMDFMTGLINSGQLIGSYGRNLDHLSEETLRSMVSKYMTMKNIEKSNDQQS